MSKTEHPANRRSLRDISNDLERLKDLILVYEANDSQDSGVGVIAQHIAFAPLAAMLYGDAIVLLTDPVHGLGPPRHQSPEAAARRRETVSTVHAIVEELRAREGTGFEILWAVRGEGGVHLDFSADRTEDEAFESVVYTMLQCLGNVLG